MESPAANLFHEEEEKSTYNTHEEKEEDDDEETTKLEEEEEEKQDDDDFYDGWGGFNCYCSFRQHSSVPSTYRYGSLNQFLTYKGIYVRDRINHNKSLEEMFKNYYNTSKCTGKYVSHLYTIAGNNIKRVKTMINKSNMLANDDITYIMNNVIGINFNSGIFITMKPILDNENASRESFNCSEYTIHCSKCNSEGEKLHVLYHYYGSNDNIEEIYDFLTTYTCNNCKSHALFKNVIKTVEKILIVVYTFFVIFMYDYLKFVGYGDDVRIITDAMLIIYITIRALMLL